MLDVEGMGKSRSCVGSTLGAVIWRHALENTADLALCNRCELMFQLFLGSGLSADALLSGVSSAWSLGQLVGCLLHYPALICHQNVLSI